MLNTAGQTKLRPVDIQADSPRINGGPAIAAGVNYQMRKPLPILAGVAGMRVVAYVADSWCNFRLDDMFKI